MKQFNPLRLLILAYLQSLADSSASRYEVMTNINLLFGQIDAPYSPGAFYHETKKLAIDEMIEFNQDVISITPHGASWLKEQLTSAPLPGSIVGRIYFLSAAALLRDPDARRTAFKRMEIDMINFNHNAVNSGQSMGTVESVTDIWLPQLRTAIKRTVSEFVA